MPKADANTATAKNPTKLKYNPAVAKLTFILKYH
jgi:hypothetical protein